MAAVGKFFGRQRAEIGRKPLIFACFYHRATEATELVLANGHQKINNLFFLKKA
jgi:hypothetical protein